MTANLGFFLLISCCLSSPSFRINCGDFLFQLFGVAKVVKGSWAFCNYFVGGILFFSKDFQ